MSGTEDRGEKRPDQGAGHGAKPAASPGAGHAAQKSAHAQRHEAGTRDAEEVRRHESHLVSQIYHLIEANQKLEEQVDRLSKVTEIAALFRERRITPDTFELQPPSIISTAAAQQAWSRIEVLLDELASGPALGQVRGLLGQVRAGSAGATPEAWAQMEALLEGLSTSDALVQMRDMLGLVRTADRQVDADWLADVRRRLIAAEQAIAFLNEQTRELDMLRREKDAIVDGAARLEQNIDDLWKALNEKTTHIQRLESQLQRIWESKPYRAFAAVRRGFKPKPEDRS